MTTSDAHDPAEARGDRPVAASTERVASNVVLLVPEAQPAVDLCNAAMSPEARLLAPAHITLVYPFIDLSALDTSRDELEAFFRTLPVVRFVLEVGWFGREVLLLRPTPEEPVVEITEQIIARWPSYPYYGGQYNTIEPHVSLGFGAAAHLEPLAVAVAELMPIRVEISEVSVLAGPHERMTVWATFPIEGAPAG